MMFPEKLNSIERALIAAAVMAPSESRRIVKLICEAGMTTAKEVPQQSEGDKHFAKRDPMIKRMKSAADRVIDYAKHETLRNCETHFRTNPAVKAGEDDPSPTLPDRLTFKKSQFSDEFLAALREETSVALGVAGQQLFDEIGVDDPWKLPAQIR